MKYNRKRAMVLLAIIWVLYFFSFGSTYYEVRLFFSLLVMMITAMYLYGEIFCAADDDSLGG